MSINTDSSHFVMSGNMLHDIVGPISSPNVGPTLPAQLSAMVNELVLSTPDIIMQKYVIRHSVRYAVKNASNVVCADDGTLFEFIFTGNTACGCSMRRNSFLSVLKSITERTALNPPLVDPEHAPRNMHTESTTHVM